MSRRPLDLEPIKKRVAEYDKYRMHGNLPTSQDGEDLLTKEDGIFISNAMSFTPNLITEVETLRTELAGARQEIARLTTQAAGLHGQLERERLYTSELLRVGNQLANMAYNGMQSDRVPTDYRDSMRGLVALWDNARAAGRTPPPEPGRDKKEGE